MLRVFLCWPGGCFALFWIGAVSPLFRGGVIVVWLFFAALVQGWSWRWMWWMGCIGWMVSVVLGSSGMTLRWFEVIHREGTRLPRIAREEMAWARTVRAWGVGRFSAVLSQRNTSLAAGLLYGETVFSSVDRALIQRVGVSHLVAVSGANLSFLVSLCAIAWQRISKRRWWSMVCAQIVIIGLVILTGAPSSMVRAGIMATITLWAKIVGRPASFARALLVSVMCMTVLRPERMIVDVGFQFSVAACLGLLTASVYTKPKTPWWKQMLFTNLCAWMWTLPIQLWVFQRYSWVGLIAGAVLAPYVEVLQVGLAALFLWPHPWLAWWVEHGLSAVWGWLAWLDRLTAPAETRAPAWLIIGSIFALTTLLIHKIVHIWVSHASNALDKETANRCVELWRRWLALSIMVDTHPDLVIDAFVSILSLSARQTRH